MNLLASHNKDKILIIRIKHPQDSLCSHQPKNPESFLTFLYKFLESYADIKKKKKKREKRYNIFVNVPYILKFCAVAYVHSLFLLVFYLFNFIL